MTAIVSRDTSPSNTTLDLNGQKSAFYGASHAFSQHSRPPKPSSKAYTGTNGALAAATSVGPGDRRQDGAQSNGYLKGNTGVERNTRMRNVSNGDAYSQRSSNPTGQTSGGHVSQSREQSPSRLAARMAVSQSTTPPREQLSTSKSNSRRPSPLQNVYNESLAADLQVDGSPSVATQSLVKLFESKQISTSPARTQSVRYTNKPEPRIASPTPTRPLIRSTTSASILPESFRARMVDPRSEPIQKQTPSRIGAHVAASKLAGPAMGATTGQRRNIPEPPAPRKSRSAPDGPQETTIQPTPSPPSKLTPALKPVPRQTSMTLDNRVQAPRSVRSSMEITRSSDGYIPQLSVDSLADAMVASSLASSRASSPTRSAPPPLPRRRMPHLFHRNHSQEHIPRTPSPANGMRQTMREPAKSDSEEEGYKKKNHLVRKHHHKHHEGDRKRYRNQVTERERKRYEGVWAANKGLCMPPASEPASEVLNIVVRDIWRRSRLPDDVLEEVWDLVNVDDGDSIGREEFVVGMWLIDQRLKGNKLPIKVSESIWSSVRRLTGTKAPKNRR